MTSATTLPANLTWAQQTCYTTNSYCEAFEGAVFNKGSHQFILGAFSGAARTGYGIAQLAIGIILQVGGFFKSLFSDNDVVLLGDILTRHGALNILRGITEMLPFTSFIWSQVDHDKENRYGYNETIVKIPTGYQVNCNAYALATKGQTKPSDRVVGLGEQIQTGIDQGLFDGVSTI